ncbi:MAG: HAD family hydrolase [Gammaproteobacteria bacterium]
MYRKERLLILDADGTTIDAFRAIERTFALHGMDIGDLERFQSRRHLFKYIGGLKEFPSNLKRQLGRKRRSQLIDTLTQVYRDEARLFDHMGEWINALLDREGLRVGLVTRNITTDPLDTLKRLFARHGVDLARMDFLIHISRKDDKTGTFRKLRAEFAINPALSYACGDEKKDYVAALSTGIHPFMVSYGFENHSRLTRKIGVPEELISTSPAQLRERVCQCLDMPIAESANIPGRVGTADNERAA